MMSVSQSTHRNIASLVAEYESVNGTCMGDRLHFDGIGDKDVYNISAPFMCNGIQYITGRVESRERMDSVVLFFVHDGSVWRPATDVEPFELEDGFITHIHGELVFGGVQTYPNPTTQYPDGVGYRTVFYRGSDPTTLRQYAVGPDLMKDIRVIDLGSDRIGVFTRPQGGIYGRGVIGYTELASMDELTPDRIMQAEIIPNQFQSDEWGGANELHLLDHGRIGVLGHIACFDDDLHRHYYACTFIFDPLQHRASPLNIIASRANFPSGPARRPDLVDVVFPGGLLRTTDGSAVLYAGLSDATAGFVTLPDPFLIP